MAEYLVKDYQLIAIANIIREKCGISEKLTFPADFQIALLGLETGGGLPSDVSALATGTVTPAEDKTSTLEITHNLGAVPNFLVWWDTADYSSETRTSMAVMGAVFEKQVKASSTGTVVHNHHFSIHGFNANGASGHTGSRAANTERVTTTTAALVCNSTYQIKAGHTYRWVCGVMA